MKIALKTAHNLFVSAQNAQGLWRLVGDRSALKQWETFDLIDVGNLKVALKTFHGRYVGAQPSGAVIADRTAVSPTESWDLIDLGSSRIALRSFQGKYLVALPKAQGWLIAADRTQLRPWETFLRVAVA